VLFAIPFLGVVKSANGTCENGSIEVPCRFNIPNIDGKWSTMTEWSNASENMIQNQYGWTMYVRMMHNASYLFVLVDFITDQSDNHDYARIGFDTANDGGNCPKVDDYLFECFAARGGSCLFQGKGTGGVGWDQWTEIDWPDGAIAEWGFSRVCDPYEPGRNHQIYEFQIPCGFLGDNNAHARFYGFYIYATDNYDTLLEWPPNAGGDCSTGPPAPGNWGDIESKIPFINPHFSFFSSHAASSTRNDDLFDQNDTLYVASKSFYPNSTYSIYVVTDVVQWTDGMSIPTRVPGTATTVTTNKDGHLLYVAVWTPPLARGDYDIVVDVNGNGRYDENFDAIDSQAKVGFQVIPEFSGAALGVSALVALLTIGLQRKKPKAASRGG
jgi:hypothetical protein